MDISVPRHFRTQQNQEKPDEWELSEKNLRRAKLITKSIDSMVGIRPCYIPWTDQVALHDYLFFLRY